MSDQKVANLSATARQEIQHAWRCAGLLEQIGHPRRDHRRQTRGLQDDRVARHQRRRGHATRDRQRKVPRRDDHADPERVIRQLVVLAGQARQRMRAREAHSFSTVVLQEVDRLGGVPVGFWPRLARLVNHRGAEEMLPRTHERGHFEQQSSALARLPPRPVGKSGPGRVERPLGLSLPGPGDTTHTLCLLARIQTVDPGARGNVLAADDERPFAREFVFDATQGGQHRLTLSGV